MPLIKEYMIGLLRQNGKVFTSCVVMLGIFHILMMHFGITGKFFGPGGYRDLLVSREVIAEGSVDCTLSGKLCNRSVRAVKLKYEALSCMLFDKLIEEMEGEDVADFSQIEEYMHVFTEDLRE